MKEPISIKPIRNQFNNYMILYFNISVLNMDNMILLMCSTCMCVSCIVFFVVRVNRNLANMSSKYDNKIRCL